MKTENEKRIFELGRLSGRKEFSMKSFWNGFLVGGAIIFFMYELITLF